MLPCAHGVDCSCQQATAYRAHPEHPVVLPLVGHSGRAEGARRVDAASIQGDLHATGGHSVFYHWSPLMPHLLHVLQALRPALCTACENMAVLPSCIIALYGCTLTFYLQEAAARLEEGHRSAGASVQGQLLMPAWHHTSICRQFLNHMQLFSFCSSTYWCGARLDPYHCTQLPFTNCWQEKLVGPLHR